MHFELTEQEGSIALHYCSSGKSYRIDLPIKTGKSLHEPKDWEQADELDPYIDVILMALDKLSSKEQPHESEFVSSPQTIKHKFLKWFLSERLVRAEVDQSQWLTRFRKNLDNKRGSLSPS